MVEEFLRQEHLVFDADTLRGMFDEADFRREGSICAADLKGILTGETRSEDHRWDLD